MTLTEKLTNIGRMYAAAVPNCYHYWRPASIDAPWLVWAEDSGAELVAGNTVAEFGISGTADYFTKTEMDEAIDRINAEQNRLAGFVWNLNSVQYEEETGLIHYEWTWSYMG